VVRWELTERGSLSRTTTISAVGMPGGAGAAFSPDGTLLATAGCGAGDETVSNLQSDFGGWFSVWAPDYDNSKCALGQVRLWEVTTGKLRASLATDATQAMYATAFSADGNTVAAASQNGWVAAWNVKSGSPIAGFFTGPAVVTVPSLAVSSDGRTLAYDYGGAFSPGGEASTGLWDVGETEPPSHPLVPATQPMGSDGTSPSYLQSDYVQVSPDGRTLALIGCRKLEPDPTYTYACALWTIVLYNMATHRIAAQLDTFERPASGMQFSPNGEMIAFSGCELDRFGHCAAASVDLWDISTHAIVALPSSTRSQPVRRLVFGPGGGTLAALWSDGAATIWDVPARRIRSPWPPAFHIGEHAIADLALSPDGSSLATLSYESSSQETPMVQVRTWDLARAQVLRDRAVNVPLGAIKYSADGHTLALADANGLLFWDASTLQQKAALALSGAFTAPLGGLAQRWSAVPAQLYWDWSLTPDWSMAAFGVCASVAQTGERCERYAIQLWDVQANRPIGRPFADVSSVNNLAFTPDGSRLVTAGPVTIWDVGPQSWASDRSLPKRDFGVFVR
jgi:WD40 repeat protein